MKFSSAGRFDGGSWGSRALKPSLKESLHFRIEPPYDSGVKRILKKGAGIGGSADRFSGFLSFAEFRKKSLQYESHLGPGAYNPHKARKKLVRRRRQGEGFGSTTPRGGLTLATGTSSTIGPGSYIELERDAIAQQQHVPSLQLPSSSSSRWGFGSGRDVPCATASRAHRSAVEDVPPVGLYDVKDQGRVPDGSGRWMFKSTTQRSAVNTDAGHRLAPNHYRPKYGYLLSARSHRAPDLPDSNFTRRRNESRSYQHGCANSNQANPKSSAGEYQPDYDVEVARDKDKYAAELRRVAALEEEEEGSGVDSEEYLGRILADTLHERLSAKDRLIEAENKVHDDEVDDKYKALRDIMGEFQLDKRLRPRRESVRAHKRPSTTRGSSAPKIAMERLPPRRPSTITTAQPSMRARSRRGHASARNAQPPPRPPTTRLNSHMFRCSTPRDVFKPKNRANPPVGAYEVAESFENLTRKSDSKSAAWGTPWRGKKGERKIG
jgi:hypothetical protein